MNGNVDLQAQDLLAALNHNLDQKFFSANRNQAKQLFNQLNDEQAVSIMRLGFSDDTEIHCQLALDKSEHQGNLSFSNFRKHLAMMMLGIKKRLDEKAPLNMMESDNNEFLFNIPGIVQSEETTRILVCGFTQNGPGNATIKLMYLNPEHYAEALDSAPQKSA
jgi:hypothetical protein